MVLEKINKVGDIKEIPPEEYEQLVGVGLVPHVPDQLVLRKIQREVQCHSQLHSPQIRA